MNTKNILVSFLAVFAVLFLVVTTVSAVEGYKVTHVEVDDGVNTIEAGETITVEVWFTAGPNTYDQDATVEATIDADDFEVSAETREFDVRPNDEFKKTLRLEIPEELDDKLYDDEVVLEIEIRGDEYRESGELVLSVKRFPDSVAIRSVSAPQAVSAGENFPVDVVLKNIGYNDLDDLYVSAKISALNVQRSAYFGDIVAIECDDNDEDEFPWSEDVNANDGLGLDRKCNEDEEDAVVGRLFLEVPYGVPAGIYTLEVVAENKDATSTKTVQIVVENEFESTVFKSGNSLWVVNPTDSVAGYRIVPESPASVSESIVFVPAGASKTVDVSPNTEGEYEFGVKVFTLKGELVDTVTFSGSEVPGTEQKGTNPIVILTVVLAIIFIVLLIVLIVLIGKKPEKSGEFGESYY